MNVRTHLISDDIDVPMHAQLKRVTSTHLVLNDNGKEFFIKKEDIENFDELLSAWSEDQN